MNQALTKKYLDNIKVNFITGCYLTVNEDWRDINYIPSFNKLYLIESGEGWLKIGDIEIYPKKFQLIYMPANILQSYSYVNENYFTKYWCHFTAEIGELNLFDILKLPFVMQLNPEQFTKISKMFKAIYKLNNSKQLSSRLKIKAILLNLLAFILDNNEIDLNINLTQSANWINNIMLYIEEHLAEDLKISFLAKQVHFHPNYFIKQFKLYLGISPVNYINQRRVYKAQSLLVNTNLSITEIATNVGIKDSAYFSKVFKSYTLLTPRLYRKINTNR